MLLGAWEEKMPSVKIPSVRHNMNRETNLQRLNSETFDIFIIGGGATGAGIALDASLRGYKTALVDGADFSFGASSRSTKLLHGGVRYLEKAFFQFDRQQLHFVKDSLHERATLMRIAPHLTTTIDLILPLYSTPKKYYYWAGLKVYEWLAGRRSIGKSCLLSSDEVRSFLPGIRTECLKGGVSYADGQFDDARFNVALVQTCVKYGCTALNYAKVTGFIKEAGKIVGVHLQDQRNGMQYSVKAKVVINATGCMADKIRQMDDAHAALLLAPSRGSHITVRHQTLPLKKGFLIPGTTDGRVIFGLPWHNEVIIGTTDIPCEPEEDPLAREEEIDYLLRHINEYFQKAIDREDVTSSWSGVRPLYKGSNDTTTSNLSRDHYIERSASGLYTIVGGKWTTYRLMAKDALDTAIRNGDMPPRADCTTDETLLVGALSNPEELANELIVVHHIPKDVAQHLVSAYGTEAKEVIKHLEGKPLKRLHEKWPYLEVEVVYILHTEGALTADDVLYRRLRVGFLNKIIAESMRPRIDEIISLCYPKSRGIMLP